MFSEINVKVFLRLPVLIIFTRLSSYLLLNLAVLFITSETAACPTLVLLGDLRYFYSNSLVV